MKDPTMTFSKQYAIVGVDEDDIMHPLNFSMRGESYIMTYIKSLRLRFNRRLASRYRSIKIIDINDLECYR